MPDKIQTPVAIARSGVYQYLKRELPGFQLPPIPEQYKNQEIFNVYRPATVLAAAVEKFTKLPLIKDHVAVVTPENFSLLAKGWTGDTAIVEMAEGKDEVIIKSTVNILDEEGLALYEAGQKQVSPYYYGKFSWKPGTASDGQEYQITMDEIFSVNHLAMVAIGRGGNDAVMDNAIKRSSGLFHLVKMMLEGIKDSEGSNEFRTRMDSLVKMRTVLNKEDFDKKVNELKILSYELPMSKETEVLDRYFEDLPKIAEEENDEIAQGVALVITNLFEKLEDEGIKEIMSHEQAKGEDMFKGKAKDADAEEKEKKVAEANETEAKAKDGKAKDGDEKKETEEDEEVEKLSKELAAEWKAFHEHLQAGHFGDMGGLSGHMKDGGKIADWEPEEKKEEEAKDGKAKDKEEKPKEAPKEENPKEEDKVKGEAGDNSPFNARLDSNEIERGKENPFTKKYLRREDK